MTLTSAALADKLLTVQHLEDRLAETEPLDSLVFDVDGDSKITWDLPNGWNVGLKDRPGTDTTDAYFSVGPDSFALTKDAALQGTSAIGLTRDYVSRTPGNLIAEQLNWWYGGPLARQMQVLSVDGTAVAFTKTVVQSFSNLDLLSTMMQGIYAHYGHDTEVVVDYKLHHDIRQTNFRLIIPEHQRKIASARGTGSEDIWSVGLDAQNSLTNEAPLAVKGYLFAWFCTNGATSTHKASGSFSRKGSPDKVETEDWISAKTENIFDGLEHELDAVQDLTQVGIEGEVNDTLRDILERYRVPAQARERIVTELIESEDLTLYGVMAAITSAANSGDLSHTVVRRLLEVGGDLPGVASGRCESCHRLPI